MIRKVPGVCCARNQPRLAVLKISASKRDVRCLVVRPPCHPVDCSRVTLVMYRTRVFATERNWARRSARVRYIRLNEAVRGCGGRGHLWGMNDREYGDGGLRNLRRGAKLRTWRGKIWLARQVG